VEGGVTKLRRVLLRMQRSILQGQGRMTIQSLRRPKKWFAFFMSSAFASAFLLVTLQSAHAQNRPNNKSGSAKATPVKKKANPTPSQSALRPWARNEALLEAAAEAWQAAFDKATRQDDAQGFADAEAILKTRALPLVTPDAPLEAKMAIQLSLGLTLMKRAERTPGRDGEAFLTEAAEVFRSGSGGQTRLKAPVEWANFQNILSLVLTQHALRIDGRQSIDLLTTAAAASRAAMEIDKRAEAPAEWAEHQQHLGTVLVLRAQRQSGEDSLKSFREATIALRAALLVLTRQPRPSDWDSAQFYLGLALRQQSMLINDPSYLPLLKESETAHRRALEVRTRQAAPMLWANSTSELAYTLSDLGHRAEVSQAMPFLTAAINEFRATEEVFTRTGAPRDWVIVQLGIAPALMKQFEITRDQSKLNEAKTRLEAAISLASANGAEPMAEQGRDLLAAANALAQGR
jgi:hypothetical protein